MAENDSPAVPGQADIQAAIKQQVEAALSELKAEQKQREEEHAKELLALKRKYDGLERATVAQRTRLAQSTDLPDDEETEANLLATPRRISGYMEPCDTCLMPPPTSPAVREAHKTALKHLSEKDDEERARVVTSTGARNVVDLAHPSKKALPSGSASGGGEHAMREAGTEAGVDSR